MGILNRERTYEIMKSALCKIDLAGTKQMAAPLNEGLTGKEQQKKKPSEILKPSPYGLCKTKKVWAECTEWLQWILQDVFSKEVSCGACSQAVFTETQMRYVQGAAGIEF